ncbi:hypothetical protein [Sanguibacter antarcticus]|uniref:Uncharacterized protein n=1 Tax=Sanguibacter antarcticus TaxID=372484 RepID=A0A2A9E7Y1_9MICO|nr:hypothetical protein [Sanguibacter antarcticus]PFG34943.1 hypothetical protein ATL42_2875 [Sanguibacter antarcticus]
MTFTAPDRTTTSDGPGGALLGPGRRTILRIAGIAVLVPIAVSCGIGAGPASARENRRGAQTRTRTPVDPVAALANAFEFLDERTPLDPGTEGYLPRSYTGGHLGDIGYDSASVYDCALVVLAYLARGTPDDVARATKIGDVLVAVQLADPAGDSRLRSSYTSVPEAGVGRPRIASTATMTGNQAWVGMAFVRLFEHTGAPQFRDAALRTATFVVTTAYDARGVGGFSGGSTGTGTPLTWRSTEHNADCVGFFTQLARATGDQAWAAHAETARVFVRSMWQGDHFHVGTVNDGITPNVSPIFEDVQTWTYLALREPAYATSLDYTLANLVTTDGPVRGTRVFVTDEKKVWLEGTGHLACALSTRASRGDAARASALRTSIWRAQVSVETSDGRGIPAASSDGLSSGEGDEIYTSLHTGATAWAALAALEVNPFA